MKRIAILAAAAASLFASTAARAQQHVIDIYLPQKIVHPLAAQDFAVAPGTDAALARAIPDALGRDLEFTGLFKVIDHGAYLEKPGSVKTDGTGTKWEDWSAIRASILVRGEVKLANGRYSATVFAFDVNGKTALGNGSFDAAANDLTTLEHRLADRVYKLATGEDSFFHSRLAFMNNRNGSKELFTAAFDGTEEQQVTKNRSINIAPSWSPDGKKIVFTSYVRAHPDLYLYDRGQDKFFRVSAREGINIGGVWAPVGRVIAATLSPETGNPDIYLMQEDGKGLKRLTDHYGNDVNPTWSPDAQRIAFVSDRGGSPNIYVMSQAGTNQTRLTFENNGAVKDNENPNWSPRGDRIAFQGRVNGAWQIFTMKPDGTDAHAVTSQGSNEDPSWSPDGRMLAFIHDGKVWVMEADGSNARAVSTGSGTFANVAWSPRIAW
ncbi:MAG TPA: hypothetical protein VMV18_05900 [bacterium]|nr:hypothetical protein [bacterium]